MAAVGEIDKEQNQVLKDKVDYKIFFWVIGIIIGCLGGLFGMYMSVKSELSAYNSKMSTDIGTIQGDVKSIKTDIGWIKEAITTDD
jgi:uncharacterized membrane-anchored protein